jgi:hypothetical protein
VAPSDLKEKGQALVDGGNHRVGAALIRHTSGEISMATKPPPPDQADPIDPTIPGELPPVITPDELPNEPDGIPPVGPDTDRPGQTPDEVPLEN